MEYFERVSRAVGFIEDHLREAIPLERIAEEACLSSFHFHRIFQTVVGLPVGDYIRKRRISCAAKDLSVTRRRIIDIAFDYQFESQSAFTRSFRKLAQVSPGRYRKDRLETVLFEKRLSPESWPGYQKGGTKVEVKIVDRDEFFVVGLECLTTQKENRKNMTIPKTWQKFNSRSQEIRNTTNPCYGIGLCEFIPNYSEDKPFRHLCSLTVRDLSEIPESMTGRKVPASRYAVFTHKGPIQTLSKTYDQIYKEWLPTSGYELALADDFEQYDDRFLGPAHEESVMEIYIPIKK